MAGLARANHPPNRTGDVPAGHYSETEPDISS